MAGLGMDAGASSIWGRCCQHVNDGNEAAGPAVHRERSRRKHALATVRASTACPAVSCMVERAGRKGVRPKAHLVW